jgi:hypothetical protein
MVLGAGALFIGVSYLVTARRYGVGGMDRKLMTTVGIAAAVLIFMGVRFKQLKLRVEAIPPGGPGG